MVLPYPPLGGPLSERPLTQRSPSAETDSASSDIQRSTAAGPSIQLPEPPLIPFSPVLDAGSVVPPAANSGSPSSERAPLSPWPRSDRVPLSDRAPLSDRSPDSSAIRHMVSAIKSLRVEEAPVLAQLAPRLREFFRMDAFVAFGLLPGPNHWTLDFLHTAGFSQDDEQAIHQFVQQAPARFGAFDPARPEEEQRNRALLLRNLGQSRHLFENPAFHILRHLGVHAHDQLRALICDGPQLLAWVGGFRRKGFSGREQFLLSALVPALIPRLRWERQFRSAGVMMAGLTAVLERLPYAAFIVRSTHAILFANEAGQALRRNRGGDLLLFRMDGLNISPVPGFDIKLLQTPGYEPHYLVTQAQVDVDARVEALRGAWGLTRRQREVLALLVQGDSNRAIAEKLGCALRTAELHVSNVIRKADVNSRTELTARFWGAQAPRA